MGRLDDAAKRKVVELRQAGLSFRKIKAVLELENIKVSAQAIYLFLKEFKGKSRPKEAGGGAGGGARAGGGATQPGTAASGDGSDGAGRQVGWADQQVWSLLRDTSRASGYASPQDSSQQGGTPRAGGRPSGGAADGSAGGGRMEQQGGRKEDGIRIVSVTSLARGAQHGGPQMAGAGTGALMGAGMRRKAPMSPASSAILVARKRLLDKALLHKARMREMSAQPGQQAGQLYGRGQACFQGNDARKVSMLPQTSTLDLTSARLPQARGGLESQPVPSLPKRTLQRPGPPARSLHPPFQRDPPPCIAVRPPNPAPAPPAGQGHGAPARSQPPPNPAPRKEPPGAPQDGAWRGGMQEQMQALGAEIRGLGMAVRLMMEQQSRVEREQAQQTQVQRQILSTLQALASALRPAKTPTPPGPAPYRRDSHTPTRTTYAQCSQPPLSKYCELEASGLDSLESYKLPALGSPRVNGFQACAAAAADGLGLGPAQAHAPAYTPPYAEPHAEVFAQSYGSPSYSAQSHAPAYSQAYPETHAQPADYPAAAAAVAAADPLRGCSPATNLNPNSPLPLSPHDPQLNIIKVETM